MELMLGVLRQCWTILTESAPYILFGFFAAGAVKALISETAVAKHLGGSNLTAVLKASLIGVPMPLCSCGVIPAAVGLRRQGASKGASAAFLVSVPETGVDSVALTWALLDPLMTLIRPVTAFLTATVTGLLINRLPEEPADRAVAAAPACGCSGGCGEPVPQSSPALPERLKDGMKYAFGDMFRDIGGWLMLGIVIAGTISSLVPGNFFDRFIDHEAASLLIMLVVGIPLYICASASTPVAAALVLKGLSPGAALVFLLAGPATNAATIAVVWRFWGRAATLVYLVSIAGCSLLLGWLTNRLYAWSGADIGRWLVHPEQETAGPFTVIAAILFLLLLLYNWLPRSRNNSNCCGD